jgi:hypothetical protein
MDKMYVSKEDLAKTIGKYSSNNSKPILTGFAIIWIIFSAIILCIGIVIALVIALVMALVLSVAYLPFILVDIVLVKLFKKG